MRYDNLVLASEQLVKEFRWDMNNLELDVVDMFTEEVIGQVLEYAADKETAKGSIDEFIRESVDLYSSDQIGSLETFKQALESFCYGIHQLLLENDAYDDTGCLEAKFERFLGDDIVIKRMTQDELAATGPRPRTGHF